MIHNLYYALQYGRSFLLWTFYSLLAREKFRQLTFFFLYICYTHISEGDHKL